MTDEEKVTEIAHTMYDARRSLRSLLGDRYAGSIAPYRAAVRTTVRVTGCKLIEVPMIVRKATPEIGGVDMAWILAAVVEEIEAEAGR